MVLLALQVQLVQPATLVQLVPEVNTVLKVLLVILALLDQLGADLQVLLVLLVQLDLCQMSLVLEALLADKALQDPLVLKEIHLL